MNFFIIGSGKIGIDLYIKLNKLNLTGKKVLIASTKSSKGVIFCTKKGINYGWDGINFFTKINFVCHATLPNFNFPVFCLHTPTNACSSI